jgi:hypothetical protein
MCRKERWRIWTAQRIHGVIEHRLGKETPMNVQ